MFSFQKDDISQVSKFVRAKSLTSTFIITMMSDFSKIVLHYFSGNSWMLRSNKSGFLLSTQAIEERPIY